MYSDYGSNTGMGAAGTSETVKPTPRPIATKPVVPAKPAAPNKQSTGFYMPPETRDKPNFSNEGRTKPAPAVSAAPAKPTMDTKAMNENAKKAMADDPSSLMGMAGAGAAALFGASRLGKLFKGAKKAAGAGRDLVVSSPKGSGSSMGRADDERAAKAREKLMKSSFIKKSGDDVTDVVAKRRGGAVKKYASGGTVSSASRRADGIATKGKTRGKMC
jgi:hypothetical protein